MNKSFDMLILAFLFFCATLERYSIDVGLPGSGIKAFHLAFLPSMVLFLFSFVRIRITYKELLLLTLAAAGTILSNIFAIYPLKSWLWTFHIAVCVFGPLSIGYFARPSPTTLFQAVTLGSLPAALYSFFQLSYFYVFSGEWVSSRIGNMPRVSGTAYEPGYLSQILFAGSVVALVFLLSPKKIYRKLFSDVPILEQRILVFCSFVNLAMAILSTGRTGWLCIATFIILLLIKAGLSINVRSLAIMLAAGVLLVMNESLQSVITEYMRRDMMSDPRVQGMLTGLNVGNSHPLLGVGVGGFGRAIMDEFPEYINRFTNGNLYSFEFLEWNLTPFNPFVEHFVNFGLIGLAWLLLGIWMLRSYCKGENQSVIWLFFLANIIGGALNQNFFRVYVLFVPLAYWGGIIASRLENRLPSEEVEWQKS